MERLVLWHRVFPPSRVEQDDPSAVGRWIAHITDRLIRAGAKPLGCLGGSTAVAFDLTEIHDALAIALALLDDAEEEPPIAALGSSVGIATGELEMVEGLAVGSAIDRAQLLATRARKGELAIDAATRELASGDWLFGRSIGTGAAALRGTAIDRTMPKRAECRAAIAHLRPAPTAPATKDAMAAVREYALLGQGCIALRGPSGAGARRYFEQLAKELNPPLALRISGVPGGLEPLGSLRHALLRAFERPERVGERLGDTLAAVSAGETVHRDELFEAAVRAFDGAWLLLDPVPSIDPSTVKLLGALITEVPLVIAARVPVEAPIPKPLRKHSFHDVVLPSLRLDDAKVVAAEVLGEDADEDVIRRVAVLGGDTPLGVVEAARTLVAVGDVIRDGDRYRWRTTPRAGVRSIPTDRLLGERLSGLEEQPLRMLEAICITPAGTPRLLVAGIASNDGLTGIERRESVAQLHTESWIIDGPQLEPASELLRRLVISRMPPARRAELCRFAAAAMQASALFQGDLVQASVGHFLAEGGDKDGGARCLLVAAEAALAGGYSYAPRRLAAIAVQMFPHAHIREAAAAISRAAAPEEPAEHGEGSVSQVAIHALLSGDLDAVERTIEVAIAEGRDLAAADRMRAMTHLAKGDTEAAMKALERVKLDEDQPDYHARARWHLTRSWIFLHAGNGEEAVRSGLAALAATRTVKDPRGEAAALHTLAACYRTLGRPEAESLADSAPV